MAFNDAGMTEVERFRRRLEAAGARIPDELVDVVVALAAPLVLAHDRLVELELGDVEPFDPALHPVVDATSCRT